MVTKKKYDEDVRQAFTDGAFEFGLSLVDETLSKRLILAFNIVFNNKVLIDEIEKARRGD